MVGLDELTREEEELFLSPSDPVVIELNRLQNQLKDKDRELAAAYGEIKVLRLTQVLKDKAVEEFSNEMKKLDEKLRANENFLEQKNLEIQKLTKERREALAAQFAAEATLRRVHANQKDEDSIPIEALIAPFEADIKMYKNEVTALQEDKKALERLTKSKELALLEAEKILRSALERALIVEEVQNKNSELKRQIEICQEENRVLDRTNKQKVVEVEKLSLTIQELEESILAGGVVANAIRDYQRQISELNEERRILERELARAKVSANRVAVVVANEWKEDHDKVMPVKQWLEERRFLQAEIQRLKDKLAVSERTSKAESQIKDKLRLRLKTLEEGLKHVSSVSNHFDSSCGSQKTERSNQVLGFLSNAGQRKRSTSQPRASRSPNSVKLKYGTGENITIRKNLWAFRSKVGDIAGKENTEVKENSDVNVEKYIDGELDVSREVRARSVSVVEIQSKASVDAGTEDAVSGFLYDRLQREVINLRKCCEDKDGTLTSKDEEIKVLMRKADALTKAMEIESKKLKREAAAREKEVVLVKVEDGKQKNKNTNVSKRTLKAESITLRL